MSGLGCSQNKDLHGHEAATKEKIEVKINIWTSNFFIKKHL
jgi:hypothetical protein